MSKSEASENDMRSLALTPTWSVASVLTMFVFVSLLLERSIHQLGLWLKKTDRKPLLAAVEKMKEELMLLGFISLLLTATSSIISNICIPSKFYDSAFAPCTKKEVDEETEDLQERGLLTTFFGHHSHRRVLMDLNQNTCSENSEPFVSYEGLEQLHRFIFVMAITHISYSCLTMLLAIVKIHSWRAWEDEAHLDRHNSLSAKTRAMTMQRQSTFVRLHTSTPMQRNNFFVWVTCFFRQFGSSVARADYLTLRQGFITNHNLTSTYDFHSYMIRSMEEEFQRIVGVSAPLWGFVVAFMLFNVKGSHLYFWIALIPVTLVLLVGTKLQHIIATLALESAGITGSFNRPKFRPRDELFWFKKPELLLTLIHLVLFQNSFELASFFWFWWQFGYKSCFIRNHLLVYLRIIVGFAGQFLCSYSTLPLYALVTQMGTNYKAALIPRNIRDTIHGWGKAARRRRKMGAFTDDSTFRTDTSTVMSVEEDDHQLIDRSRFAPQSATEIELQQTTVAISDDQSPPSANEGSTLVGTPLLHSASDSSPVSLRIPQEMAPRYSSKPR
ncbi:MLO-like protein 11 isoform X1 [Salvia splendens]|uniref:MLO-like protein 11 isoform X1 n=1 Tax=Salvia splendens TaxID=180675 RepID=UPI001C27D249|nr:MLO-like protein 11 isoform X1 [Salvia splendens]XP_042041508.1 MLO-like protein 11 isoform X1 [Salvia splendens]